MADFLLDDEQVKEYIDSNKAKNTVKKMRSHHKPWYDEDSEEEL